MMHPRIRIKTRAGLALGLAIALSASTPFPVLAQPISSGSGTGTGTGMSGGARNTTGTGLESGAGNATGTGNESGSPLNLPGQDTFINPSRGRNLISPGRMPSDTAIPAGPGATVTMPGDRMVPLDSMSGYSGAGTGAEVSSVSDIHLRYARSIVNPGDRSLSLSRIASAATFSNQLSMADVALTDASRAAMEMGPGMIRDQRLISIISALLYLGEAHLREGRTDLTIPDPTGAPDSVPKVDRVELIRRTIRDTRHAAQLAQQIGNPTYRAELMYRVADGLAYDSQSVVNEFPKATGSNKDSAGLDNSYEKLPDLMLQDAAAIAARIERPVWHDRALVAVASAAAESRQFARAIAVSRLIPQPEVRTDALLKVAEIQARRGDERGATSTYREAAQAVASIPLADPRAVLAGVLIDNLISVGRFEDARASITLYPDEPRRILALGSIAESQGRRGAAPSALAWINRDVPEQYRSQLYRRVSNGVVTAIENNRSRDLSNRGDR